MVPSLTGFRVGYFGVASSGTARYVTGFFFFFRCAMPAYFRRGLGTLTLTICSIW